MGPRWKILALRAVVSFMHLSKQMLSQRREPAEEGSCRDMLLVNVPRGSNISLTDTINRSKNIEQMKINKN